MHLEYDPKKHIKYSFKKLNVGGSESLAEALRLKKLRERDEILVVERGGERLAFTVYQMTYHHIAQGELAGQPYIVSY